MNPPVIQPAPNFAGQRLVIRTVPSRGERLRGAPPFRRFFRRRHPDPLGYGKGPSRFSDPRAHLPEERRFGVVYAGATYEVCFLETIFRDAAAGTVGSFPLDERELGDWLVAPLHIDPPLRLVDLRRGGATRMRVPTDVAHAASHAVSQAWSLAFHEHPENIDGILYPSRHNGQTNIAVYDRALWKLSPGEPVAILAERRKLATVLWRYAIDLIPLRQP